MSYDIRNCLRGACFACDECPSFISLSGKVLCDYCGCPPARHTKLNDDNMTTATEDYSKSRASRKISSTQNDLKTLRRKSSKPSPVHPRVNRRNTKIVKEVSKLRNSGRAKAGSDRSLGKAKDNTKSNRFGTGVEEEGSCSDEQNKAVELVAVRHGGGEHKKIKVYNCSLCNREMTNASSIVSHIQSKHAEEGKKKLRCIFPLCEHSATREDLIRHIRAKHTKEELFECKKCSKKFHTYKAMKDHVENHKYQDMCKKCNRFYRHEKCGFCKD